MERIINYGKSERPRYKSKPYSLTYYGRDRRVRTAYFETKDQMMSHRLLREE